MQNIPNRPTPPPGDLPPWLVEILGWLCVLLLVGAFAYFAIRFGLYLEAAR